MYKMQSQVYFVSSSRQVNISGVSFVRQKARVTSLMLSVVMSLLLVVASGAQAVVCVGGSAVDEGLFSVWEASSAFEQEGYAGVRRSVPESSGMC